MVKGSDNQHLEYTMEVRILRSTKSTELRAWRIGPRDSSTSSRHSWYCAGYVSYQLCAYNDLFDSGASHSFSTEQFVAKHDIPMSSMKTHLLVSSLNGEIHPCMPTSQS
jgi:hypothetical protein